jgi:hypothetical protein
MISYINLYWLFILLIGYNQRYELMFTLHELIFRYIHYWDNDFRISSISHIERDGYTEMIYTYKNGKKYKLFNKNKLDKEPYSSEQIIKKRHSRNMIKSEEDVIMAEYILTNDERIDFLDEIQELSGPLGNFHKDVDGNLLNKKVIEESYGLKDIDRIEIMNSEGEIIIIN